MLHVFIISIIRYRFHYPHMIMVDPDIEFKENIVPTATAISHTISVKFSQIFSRDKK